MHSSSGSWVWSRSAPVLTTNEPLQSSPESVPFPPLQGVLGTLVWSAVQVHPSVNRAKNRTEGKKQTIELFSWTKWGRCRSLPLEDFSGTIPACGRVWTVAGINEKQTLRSQFSTLRPRVIPEKEQQTAALWNIGGTCPTKGAITTRLRIHL